MKPFSKMVAFAAVTTLAVGGGATVASAYSVSGGSYSGTATGAHAFTVGGGAYTFSCSTHSIAGSASGADTTSFTPAYSGCSFFGFPLLVNQSGAWNLKVIGNSGSTFNGELEIPGGTSTSMSIPIMGCTFTVAGPQTFTGVTMSNWASGTGVNLRASISGIAYTAAGCPFSSGTDGTYSSGANPVTIPGLTVS